MAELLDRVDLRVRVDARLGGVLICDAVADAAAAAAAAAAVAGADVEAGFWSDALVGEVSRRRRVRRLVVLPDPPLCPLRLVWRRRC